MKYLFAIALIFGYLAGECQDGDKEKVIKTMKQLADQYHKEHFISFDVNYRFAFESNPTEIIDSLKGKYKVSGGTYWNITDKTETFYDGHFYVAVYPDDSVMYISKSQEKRNPLSGIAILDSVLQDPTILYTYEINKENTVVSLDFAGPEHLRKITYLIDNRTGFLSKITQIVPTKEMMPDDFPDLELKSKFSIVETVFSGYKTDTGSIPIGKSENYFTISNNIISPSQNYKNYKIVSSTLN